MLVLTGFLLFCGRYLRLKVKDYWAPICSLLAIKTADRQGDAVPSKFCEKKLNPTRSKTRPLLWQSLAVTPLAKQRNASRRAKPRQFGRSVTRPEGRGSCNPPGAGHGFAGRSEEALNHPHGSNLSGGKPWLQHQGPRSSTDRCNGGSSRPHHAETPVLC